MHSMARLLAWLNKYGDSGLALLLALGVGILTFADIASPNDVSGAILLTLGLVATSSLRNRAREETMDNQLHDVLQSTETMLTKLPARLDELESTVEGTRRALEESSFIRVLHGAEVGLALEEARRNTDRWAFKGGTGTFLRAVTIPECVEIARRKKHTLHMQLEIIDPANEKLCATYAQFRRSLADQPDATGEIWTTAQSWRPAAMTGPSVCGTSRRAPAWPR
jgi:hypothetical protein